MIIAGRDDQNVNRTFAESKCRFWNKKSARLKSGGRFFFGKLDPWGSELLGGFRLVIRHQNLGHFRTGKFGGQILAGGQHLANLGA